MKLQVTERTNTRGRSQPQLLTYLAGKTFQLLWVALKTTAWWWALLEPVEETTRVELFCKAGMSVWLPPPKNCWQRSWRGTWMVQRLWMALDGLCWNKICGFSAPPLKNMALSTAGVSWDCPLHTPMISALLSSSGSALHTQIQLHTMPRLHHTEHLALIAFNTHWCSSQPRNSQRVGPLMFYLSHHSHLPLMLWGQKFPQFSPSKPIFQKINTLHKVLQMNISMYLPQPFLLSTKKELRELQANFLMPSGLVKFSEDTRFSTNAKFRIRQKT